MITTAEPPAIEEVERGPALANETSSQGPGAPAAGVEPVRRPATSPISQADALLLTRLRWVAFGMLMIYGIVLIWVLATREDLHQPMVVLLGLRVTLVMVILGLLFGDLPSSPNHLRRAELALFGGLTACLLLSQYLIGRDMLRAGDVPGILAQEKDGLLELLMLIFAYGILIPNGPGRAAGVVLTMALTPFLGPALFLVGEPASGPIMAELYTIERIGQDALIVLVGAGLAIRGASLLNRLRPEVHESRRCGPALDRVEA